MSTTIDQKVVEMRFDNRNFEQNISATMSTLEKFKQRLRLDGATKGLESVSESAKRVDMGALGSAIETVQAKFSSLQVMGVTALSNITNSAVNAGKRMISALTIDPIKTGFSEYETKINAIQTIMSNTASKGTTMEDVTRVIGELNTYADKTIYNFAEMTKNIGTFTAAGVGLEESASAIQGIANLAASSGSTSQQASTAMYQLSQALASGTVKLMDWNSVVNAGMGGQKFQDALKATAREHGVAVDSLIKKNGSFRESLQEGWLSADILNETLSKFTVEGAKAYADSMVKSGKYTKEQTADLIKEAQAMEDAATKVKTFTQLWDTLKESAQSGWSQTWEIIVGDFEEAKETLTKFSEVIGGMLESSAKARNDLLQGWKDAGGRADLIDSLYNVFEGLMSILKPVKEAFREIFPPVTVKQLTSLTENLKKFTEGLTLSAETSGKLKRIFKGVFSAFDIVRKVVTSVAGALFGLSQSEGIGSFANMLLDIAASIGDFFTSLNEGFDANGLTGMLTKVVSGISGLFKSVTGGLTGIKDIFSSVGQWIGKVASKIFAVIKDTFGWISENVSMGDIFAGLAGGGIFVAAKKISGVFESIKDAILGLFGKSEGESFKDKFADILDSIKNSIQSFTTGIRVWSIVGVAVAIGVLSSALRTISELSVPDIAKSLLAIGLMMGMLTLTFKSFTKTLSKFDSKGMVTSALALILIAKAVDILAGAMVDVSDLSLEQVAKGLAAIGGALFELCMAVKIIGSSKTSLSTAVTIVALAYSCKILGEALQSFGSMSWDEIGRGLTAMGGALAELTAVMVVLSKFSGGGALLGGLGILIAVQSLDDLANALKSFGGMAWDEIGRGLTAMGGALAEVGLVLGLLGKFGGFSSIFASGAIFVTIQGLDDLANALKSFGEMSWDEIGRGLTAMGSALAEVGIITGALGKLAGFSSLFGAGSIMIVIQGLDDLANALQSFGLMSWDEIGRGLTAMGGALAEIGIITGALGKLAGFSSLFGAGSILVVVQGLGDIADNLKKFGSMSWDEIGRGLTAMGGALGEIGIISGVLGGLAGPLAVVGSGAILIAVQGLGDIADALKKFGEMSWDEIGRGLTAMGSALGELALGGFLNTLSIIGSFSISEMAEPLGVLADSVKKWSGVTVPEGLGYQLSALASGIFSFTLDGSGASAIATVAEPLGTLADSVKKWADVVVPEGIGTQLSTLAEGVSSFTFKGLGASAISTVAEPLGTLADSVKKWVNVSVPESIGTQLTSLAEGISAFSFSFMGGWSMNTIIEPLKQLPDAIKKWTGITVPEGLKDGLTSIAEGIGEFSLLDTAKLQLVDDNILSLSNAFINFSKANVDGDKLVNFAKKINECSTELKGLSTSSIDTAASAINTLTGSLKKIESVDTSKVNGFVNAANSLNKINVSEMNVNTDKLSSVVKSIKNVMESLSKEISSNKTSMADAMKTAMSGVPNSIDSKKSDILSAIQKILDALEKKIGDSKKTINEAFKNLVSGASGAIKKNISSIESAGKDLGSGLVRGINSKQQAVYNAGYALGQKAVQGEKDGQKSKSPSKLTTIAGKWLGEGLIIGMDAMSRSVYKAGYGLGEVATNSISNTIAQIADLASKDIDSQPTIRPVLDLSDVRSGVGTLGGMLNFGSSVDVLANVGSINASMNRRVQNGSTNDVITAIKKLGKDLGSMDHASYNINGVSYEEGSDVAGAIKTIVRAAVKERRV